MNTKWSITLGAFLISVAVLLGARYCPSTFWQNFLLGISVNFLILGVSLSVINIYFERRTRKGAVRALLILSQRSINTFHNKWLQACWDAFGKDETGKIFKEYTTAKGAAEALKQQVRDNFYNILKNNTEISGLVDDLDNTLVELSRLAGWDLDERLLEACLRARISIQALKSVPFDDSDQSKLNITKNILDVDIRTAKARILLRELAGVE